MQLLSPRASRKLYGHRFHAVSSLLSDELEIAMRLVGLVVTFLLAIGAQASTAQAVDPKFEDLLKLIPDSANAVVVIDVAGVHRSPVALRERWKETHERAYIDRPFILPPEAERMILAAQLDPQNDFATAFELAVMDLSEPLSLKSIARAEGGYVDQLDSTPAAWTPSDAYFLEFSPKRLGVRSPANRQDAARWANFAANNSRVVVSPYLMHAVEAVGGSTQIAMALDLRNAVQPHRLRDRIQNDMPEALRGKNVDPTELAEAITSLAGIMLTVDIGDKFRGRIQVDFERNIGVLTPVAKPLLLEVLAEMGAKIEQLQSWKAEVGPYSITLSGELSRDAMRRIFSLLELPTSKFSTQSKEVEKAESAEVILTASKRYFDSVNVLVEDLRKTLDEGAANMDVWMDRYAKKIDRLPIMHVDEELLNYGTGMADRFRQMSISKRQSGVTAGVRNANTYSGYYWGDAAYVTGAASQTDRNRIRTEERAKTVTLRMNLWKEIDEQQAMVRRTMTKKYQVEF
jgi:hypothetical protein